MIKPGRIIVVGGNAAGAAAAAKAKRVAPEAEVSLFELGDFISTGTCEIPYVLSREIERYEDIIFYSAERFKKEKGVKVFLNHRVEEINRKKKFITATNIGDNSLNRFSYDKLVIATGSTANMISYLPAYADNVFTIKTVTDLLKILTYRNSTKVITAAVIGAGYLGLETAEALKQLNIEVNLIEKETIPLPSGETEISYLISELLKEKEISFYGNVFNPKIHMKEDGKKIGSIEIDSRKIEIDVLIVSAGFTPNNSLASKAKLDIGKLGGIVTDRKLNTSDPNIFAAGDCTEALNFITNKHDYIPLATLAHEYGHVAGANAAGDNLKAESVVKNLSVRIFNNYLSTVGLSSIEADRNRFNYSSVSGFVPNLVKIMPESRHVFGKILFEKNSKRILGASFFGGKEVSGYGDIISTLIKTRQPGDILAKINYNYTPPLSPFVNLLSVLGRKIE